MDEFTVKQDHGGDSVVTVHQDTRYDPFGGHIPLLVFHTGQSLKSQSGRAWNVKEAIRTYCYERGYRIEEETPQTITARYDPQTHSGYAFGQLRDAIQADPRYRAQMQRVDEAKVALVRKYGSSLSQLRNLIAALEKAAHEAEKQIDQETADVQAEIVAGLDLPPHLLPYQREALTKPFQPALLAFGRHQGLPDDLEAILALL